MGPSTLFKYEDFSARERVGGAAPPSENLGPLVYWKLLELESGNFKHILLRSSALYGNDFFPVGGVRGAQRPFL